MTDLDKLRERYGREISSVDSTALPANHPHYAEAIGSLSPPPEVREAAERRKNFLRTGCATRRDGRDVAEDVALLADWAVKVVGE